MYFLPFQSALVAALMVFIAACTPQSDKSGSESAQIGTPIVFTPQQDAAIKLVIEALERRRTKLDCRFFMADDLTDGHIPVVMHERHGGNCPGDPNVAPVVDRFQVNLNKQEVWQEDMINDQIKLIASKSPPAWFGMDLNNDHCMQSVSPAAKIRSIQEAGYKAYAKDFGPRDAPDKVEVSYFNGDSKFTFNYWRSKQLCEAALPRSQPVPHKYE